MTKRIPLPAGGVRIETFIPWTLVQRGARREVITPIGAPAEFREEVQREKLAKHSPLLRSLGLAHYWRQLLDDGKFRSITEIAAAERMDVGRVSRVLRLAQLSPAILERCMAEGLSDPQQSTTSLRLRNAKLCDWNKQDSAQ